MISSAIEIQKKGGEIKNTAHALLFTNNRMDSIPKKFTDILYVVDLYTQFILT